MSKTEKYTIPSEKDWEEFDEYERRLKAKHEQLKGTVHTGRF